MKLVAIVLLLGLVGVSQAICPGKCSGHGKCGSSDKCRCEPGWTNPDCSGRMCAFGLSWTPSDGSNPINSPLGGMGGLHEYTECSSKGKCDRASGVCECIGGYAGKGCRRQVCPGDTECSGHGMCKYADQVKGYSPRTSEKFDSDKWDAHKTRLCACDRGWEGIDCSSRVCPKGDDPLTDCDNSNQANQVQKITVTSKKKDRAAKGYIALEFKDMYGGVYTTRTIKLQGNYYPSSSITTSNGKAKCEDGNDPCTTCVGTVCTHDVTINPDSQFNPKAMGAGKQFFDADAIRSALQELPNFAIPSVNVTEHVDVLTYTKGDGSSGFKYTSHSATACEIADNSAGVCGQSIFYVTFSDAGTSGRQNLLNCLVFGEENAGQVGNSRNCPSAQPKIEGSADNLLDCKVEEVELPKGQLFEEHSQCSERGLCDSSTGICDCYEGHTGEDCSKQTIFF